MRTSLSVASLITVCLLSADSFPKQYDGVLNDPVVLGAWLYQGHCLRCHDNYSMERLGGEYDDESDLAEAIGRDGCSIAWSRMAGGELGNTEINALVRYMWQWEEDDTAPALPELPPFVEHTAPVQVKKTDSKAQDISAGVEQESGPGQLSPALTRLLETSEIAQGGYLYTSNCYRCHLSYLQARMGKGLNRESLSRTISEGKTSTQMKPFSKMLGGDLKNSEIRAVVSYILAWEAAGEPLAIAAELMTPPALDPADFVPIRLTRYRPISGDADSGYRLYRLNCMGCHGSEKEGLIGTSLAEGTWVVRPDLFYKSVVKAGIPGSLMQGWDSNAGGSFSAKDVDDIVAYLIQDEAL